MASRSDDIKEMAGLAGNAAAHRAIYGKDAFTIREAALYEGMANKIAQARTWNDDEVNRLETRTRREARNIIKQRKSDWRNLSYAELCFLADREIDKFIQRIRQRKDRTGN